MTRGAREGAAAMGVDSRQSVRVGAQHDAVAERDFDFRYGPVRISVLDARHSALQEICALRAAQESHEFYRGRARPASSAWTTPNRRPQRKDSVTSPFMIGGAVHFEQ